MTKMKELLTSKKAKYSGGLQIIRSNKKSNNKLNPISKGGSEGEDDVEMMSDDDLVVPIIDPQGKKHRPRQGRVLPRLPHKCSRCAKRFPNLTTLNVHEEVHSEHDSLEQNSVEPEPEVQKESSSQRPRNFQCYECLRTFGREDHLNRHLRTHRNLS